MKIAILSDIHGNFDALAEVLTAAGKEKVDHLLILGDIVGYYYHPDKVLEALAPWSYDMIKGNHEEILQKLIQEPAIGPAVQVKYGCAHQLALEKLTKKQLNFLLGLPESRSVAYDGLSFLMCHGSPWSLDQYIYPDSEPDLILKCDSKEHDFVLIGHSHYAFAKHNENSILLNPGSVGQSRQKGGKASWALVDTKNGSFQQRSTDYGVERLVQEVQIKDPGAAYHMKILKRK